MRRPVRGSWVSRWSTNSASAATLSWPFPAPPQPLQRRLGDILVALRADAVAELRPRMLGAVALPLLPVVLVVADLLAVRTDGQQPLEALHLHQGLLGLPPAPLGLRIEPSVLQGDGRVAAQRREVFDLAVIEGTRPVVPADQDARNGLLHLQGDRHDGGVAEPGRQG